MYISAAVVKLLNLIGMKETKRCMHTYVCEYVIQNIFVRLHGISVHVCIVPGIC